MPKPLRLLRLRNPDRVFPLDESHIWIDWICGSLPYASRFRDDVNCRSEMWRGWQLRKPEPFAQKVLCTAIDPTRVDSTTIEHAVSPKMDGVRATTAVARVVSPQHDARVSCQDIAQLLRPRHVPARRRTLDAVGLFTPSVGNVQGQVCDCLPATPRQSQRASQNKPHSKHR